MKIEIVFKNGSKLEITCEEFNAVRDNFTGKIESYDIKGIKDNKPLFLDVDEVLYIVRKLQ